MLRRLFPFVAETEGKNDVTGVTGNAEEQSVIQAEASTEDVSVDVLGFFERTNSSNWLYLKSV